MLSPENRKLLLKTSQNAQMDPTCLSASGEGIFHPGSVYTPITGAAHGRAAVEGDMSASIPGEGERESATASSLLSGGTVPPGARIPPPPLSQLSSAVENALFCQIPGGWVSQRMCRRTLLL